MPTPTLARTFVFALAAVLTLSALGCAAEPAPPAPAPAAEESAVEPSDFSYLTGRWAVTTMLTSIDNELMRMAADQPGAQWECEVDGATMRLLTDQHEYIGSLSPEADGGWVYEAEATFTDEDGYTVTSAITVSGKPTSNSLDTFAGGMTGTISSDVDGHLYTATWDILGARQ